MQFGQIHMTVETAWKTGIIKSCVEIFKETYVPHIFIEPRFPSKIGSILLKSVGQLLSLSIMIFVISGAQIQNYRTGGEKGLKTHHWFKNEVQQTFLEYVRPKEKHLIWLFHTKMAKGKFFHSFLLSSNFATDVASPSSKPEPCFSPLFQHSPYIPGFHTIPDSHWNLSLNTSISLMKFRNGATTTY